jgi:hypothetical protein
MGEWFSSRRDSHDCHDSSQARSAWVEMPRGPVPEGRLKALSVPEVICRRNGAPA